MSTLYLEQEAQAFREWRENSILTESLQGPVESIQTLLNGELAKRKGHLLEIGQDLQKWRLEDVAQDRDILHIIHCAGEAFQDGNYSIGQAYLVEARNYLLREHRYENSNLQTILGEISEWMP